MKVCFISHSSAKGGAERALLELLDALKGKGVASFVILPRYGPIINELESLEIDFFITPYNWWMDKNPPRWLRLYRTVLNLRMLVPIMKKLRQWQCDIVCTNTITVGIGAIAAKILRRPHIWFIHEFGWEDHQLSFDLGEKLSLLLINWLSKTCMVNSEAVLQKYKNYISPSKLKVVYYSMNMSPSYEWSSGRQKIRNRCAIVGALQKGKRQEDAIKAIFKLRSDGMNIGLDIIGDGDSQYRDYLIKLVEEIKASEYIKFMGYVEDPYSYMRDDDVLLMCSQSEAFGRVTVEAMKLGKPVVGARSGGTIELIQDGFNGLLYTAGNIIELSEKIRYLYENPDIAAQMGKNGRLWVSERFSRDLYGGEVLTVLSQLVTKVRS